MNENFEEPEIDALRRHLNKVTIERNRLELRFETITAGADDTEPVEGAALTPGQLWYKLLYDQQGRAAFLESAMVNARTASECFAQDHARLKAELGDAHERIRDQQAGLSHAYGQIEAYKHMLGLQAEVAVRVGTAVHSAIEVVHEPSVEDLPEFEGDRGVREKIAGQLKSAGIDTASLCGFKWRGYDGGRSDAHDDGWHECVLVNPLHVGDHKCDEQFCGAICTQAQAEEFTAKLNPEPVEAPGE